jgi:hypothetical protein
VCMCVCVCVCVRGRACVCVRAWRGDMEVEEVKADQNYILLNTCVSITL